ncbi:MAG TPA: substrate-binding domain-containing protein [Anaerolineae bacterium]|nr:substrate-binding domain-containing protein [Anaerolineae bacterium]
MRSEKPTFWQQLHCCRNPMAARTRLGLLVILAVALAACSNATAQTPPTPRPQTTLTISGSGGATEIVKFLAKAYSQQHADLAFNFLSGAGTSGGVKGVLEGQLDLGTMSRPPKDSELAAGIAFLELGHDRVAVATSADVSITGLTGQQVKDIFLGKIRNWSAVGGPNAAINLFVRDEEDSLTQVLRAELFADAEFASGAVVLTSEGDMRDALLKATNAIGYIAHSNIRINQLSIRVVILDNLDPADVHNDYPYSRVTGIAYLPANASKLQSFLDFVDSSEVQTLLADVGMVTTE